MKIINSKADIDALPSEEKSDWLAHLAATIHRENEDGSVTTDVRTIKRFGYALEDFPDAPVAPYEPPTELPVSVPASIKAWQAKAVLKMNGLFEAAEAAIAALPEPQKTVVESAWINQADFARTSETVTSLATALGITAEQMDAMFIQAEELVV